jgi:regulator of RNase E activity RraA
VHPYSSTETSLFNRINVRIWAGAESKEVLKSGGSFFRRPMMASRLVCLVDVALRKLSRPLGGTATALTLIVAAVAAFAWPQTARTHQSEAAAVDDASLLDGFRHVEAASVSDALERITGRKMYMSHQMRPIFPTKFAGFAVTVLLKKETNHDPDALNGMLAAIDQGSTNSVYVMVVEDGSDIAGMGGLMGTAMSARNFSGAVIDGGVRDVAYLQKIGFPVYAVGIVPSTSVTHYRFAGANIPVVCSGVSVNAADIIVADADGVVVVPRASAAQVLKLAQEMDFQEHSMYAYIEKLKSIQEAVRKFGRL